MADKSPEIDPPATDENKKEESNLRKRNLN